MLTGKQSKNPEFVSKRWLLRKTVYWVSQWGTKTNFTPVV